jgi:hypothetical protein
MAIENQFEFHDMIAEKRRLEVAALAAANAVLRQSLAIWQRYLVFNAIRPTGSEIDFGPRTVSEAIFEVLNGKDLCLTAIQKVIRLKFPLVKATKYGVGYAVRSLINSGKLERCETMCNHHIIYTYKKLSLC